MIGVALSRTVVVEALLTEGPRATVYAARHPELPRRYVVKVLRAGDRSAAVTKTFLRGAQQASRIAHGNIPAIVEFGCAEDALPWLAWELAEGTPLGEVLPRVRVRHAQALSILEQLAQALQAAHEQGVSHGRLAPDAILVGPLEQREPHIHVLGFGPPQGSFADDLAAFGRLAGELLDASTLGLAMARLPRGDCGGREGSLQALGRMLADLSRLGRMARADEANVGDPGDTLLEPDSVELGAPDTQALGQARVAYRKAVVSLLRRAFGRRLPEAARETLEHIGRLEAEVEEVATTLALLESEHRDAAPTLERGRSEVRAQLTELRFDRETIRARMRALSARDAAGVAEWGGPAGLSACDPREQSGLFRVLSQEEMTVLDRIEVLITGLERQLHDQRVKEDARSAQIAALARDVVTRQADLDAHHSALEALAAHAIPTMSDLAPQLGDVATRRGEIDRLRRALEPG